MNYLLLLRKNNNYEAKFNNSAMERPGPGRPDPETRRVDPDPCPTLDMADPRQVKSGDNETKFEWSLKDRQMACHECRELLRRIPGRL